MNIVVLGIDLGKNVCSLVGLDEAGAVVLRRRAKRETLIGNYPRPFCALMEQGERFRATCQA